MQTVAATDPNTEADLDRAARIETLRNRLAFLGEELMTCRTEAERVCITKSIQTAEVDLWHARNAP